MKKRVIQRIGFIAIVLYLLLNTIPSRGQGGNTCADAYSAGTITLPFSSMGQTLTGKGNDYTSANTTGVDYFNPNFLGGEDYVYYFRPTKTSNILIRLLLNIISNTRRASILVYQGCPTTPGSKCINSVYDNPLTLSMNGGPVLLAGVKQNTDYYIIIDVKTGNTLNYGISIDYVPVQAPCNNLNFEAGNTSGWNVYRAHVGAGIAGAAHLNFIPNNDSTPPFQECKIVNGGNDTVGHFPKVCPGGNYSLFIGRDITPSQYGAMAMQSFFVDASTTALLYKYAMIFQDPSHSVTEQPYLYICVYDEEGMPIPCGIVEIVAGPSIPGFTGPVSGPGPSIDYFYKSWTTAMVDLSPYVGKLITMVVKISGCSQSGHIAYAYIDFECGQFELTATGCSPVTITAPGGFDTYKWTPGGQTSQSITVNQSGHYCCEIERDGCKLTICKDINVGSISIDADIVNTVCGQCNGSITITPESGTSPYTYKWDANAGNKTTQTVSNLCEDIYTVTITDNQGCETDTTITIKSTGQATFTSTKTDVSCFGGSDGKIDLTITSGTAPITYKWMPGNYITEDISSLPAGNYTVTVSDGIGCSVSATYTIAEPPQLTVSISNTPVSSGGACDGSATVSPNGGTIPYTYKWDTNPEQTTQTVMNLCNGNYCVTITDNNGCTETICSYISTISIITSKTDILCYGECIGSATVTVLQGTSPYQYQWSNESTTQTINNLCPGSYTVTVTDANTTTATSTLTIIQPTEIKLTLSGTDLTCYQKNNGKVSVIAIGGTPGYAYKWSNGGVISDITNLSSGSYTVTVTDGNNCTNEASVSLNEPPVLTTVISGMDALCYGSATGMVNLTPSGGTPSYTYIWSNGSQGQTLNNVTSGIYSVTISDKKGCTTTNQIVINEPVPLTITQQSQPAKCFGVCDGSANISVSGGTSPYTYKWSDLTEQTTQEAINLCAGTYIVTATDSNGCTDITSVIITEPPQLTLSILNTPVSSGGACDGSATVTPTGGTSPYSYKWSTNPVQTTQTAINLCTGDYYVTVTDKNGCTIVDTVSFPLDIPIAEKETESYTLYPNPTYGQVNIELINMTVEKAEVYDVSGRMLLSQDNTGKMILLNIAHFRQGTYFIRLVSEKQVYHQKIILQSKL